MKHKVSPATFEKILNGEFTIDKARRSRNDLVPGYQWTIQEFDYRTWTLTGREIKAEIQEIMQVTDGDVDIDSINRKYIFFRFKTI